MHSNVEKILKPLISSKSRLKMLEFFFAHPTEEFFVRELTRLLDEQINSIRRELDALQEIGLFISRTKGGKKFFRLNPQFFFYDEFFSIFQKIHSRAIEIAQHVKKMGKVEILLLTGVFIGKENDVPIDLFVVGEINTAKLQKYISSEFQQSHEIRFAVISKQEFLHRFSTNDTVLKSIFLPKENICPINTLKEILHK